MHHELSKQVCDFHQIKDEHAHLSGSRDFVISNQLRYVQREGEQAEKRSYR